MSEFKDFAREVSDTFNFMKTYPLFRSSVPKDLLWETYLNAFPEGTNPVFRERTDHDCQCCKKFIRDVGDVIAVVEGKLYSIWDIRGGSPTYLAVAKELSRQVKGCIFQNKFLTTERQAGQKETHEQLSDGTVRTWNHFHADTSEFQVGSIEIGWLLNNAETSKKLLYRALSEIKDEAVETVLDLISSESLYRGSEHLESVKAFKALKRDFDWTDLFCWLNVDSSICRIRNSVIGTLLIDLSEGKDLELAVKSFESKVAPENYQRPKSLITKGMIQKAEQAVSDLGFVDSLPRRMAKLEDLTINNVLFADRSAKAKMGIFEELQASVLENPSARRPTEIPIGSFLSDILPASKTVELLLENRHQNNLVSLTAPVNENAPGLFKWDNNFAWCYNGEVADSIKAKVKAAGGKVDGVLRCSLSWSNLDDLDIHLVEPDGTHIYYGRARSRSGGHLDIDMNAGGHRSRTPVENITYQNQPPQGKYRLFVNNFTRRENIDVGFDIEVEYKGQVLSFSYSEAVPGKANVEVASFEIKEGEIKVLESIESKASSKEAWGLNTERFQKVSLVSLSPNYWDGKVIGQKHYMFFLEDMQYPEPVRGFFNEFLKPELRDHRKVFEVLSSRMKSEPEEGGLCGVGFSNNTTFTVRIDGGREYKVTV